MPENPAHTFIRLSSERVNALYLNAILTIARATGAVDTEEMVSSKEYSGPMPKRGLAGYHVAVDKYSCVLLRLDEQLKEECGRKSGRLTHIYMYMRKKNIRNK